MPVTISTLLLGLLFFLTAAPADAQFVFRPQQLPAEDFHVELGLRGWRPTPELMISTDRIDVAGAARVDFVQEFGIEARRFREFQAVLKPARRHKIRVDYVPIRYEAEATVERQIVFGGRTFDVGMPATTEVTWDLWRFGYEWDFVSRERGFLGLLGEMRYSRVDASIESPIGTEVAEAQAPVPTIGLIGRGYLSENVSLTGELSGLRIPPRDDFEARFLDFDIYGTVNLGPHFGLQGGYRGVTIDYLVDDDSGDLRMRGTYFGAVVRF